MVSDAVIKAKVENIDKVLILVLMEYGLGHSHKGQSQEEVES